MMSFDHQKYEESTLQSPDLPYAPMGRQDQQLPATITQFQEIADEGQVVAQHCNVKFTPDESSNHTLQEKIARLEENQFDIHQ